MFSSPFTRRLRENGYEKCLTNSGPDFSTLRNSHHLSHPSHVSKRSCFFRTRCCSAIWLLASSSSFSHSCLKHHEHRSVSLYPLLSLSARNTRCHDFGSMASSFISHSLFYSLCERICSLSLYPEQYLLLHLLCSPFALNYFPRKQNKDKISSTSCRVSWVSSWLHAVTHV